ncbi:hypothetical protein M408DRAFT_125648 [Serendipita vermifera MAFF 305830]|uniref:Uncharacterized protein n=1 Tax=Serendipita vermifera MAFF 305830 TaxID=933852 RepID=A0A0C3AWP6_SERVB|nr:hypothetical protein M408DRAFT_125648 [Serendipita vermifera MAFF 305830]
MPRNTTTIAFLLEAYNGLHRIGRLPHLLSRRERAYSKGGNRYIIIKNTERFKFEEKIIGYFIVRFSLWGVRRPLDIPACSSLKRCRVDVLHEDQDLFLFRTFTLSTYLGFDP